MDGENNVIAILVVRNDSSGTNADKLNKEANLLKELSRVQEALTIGLKIGVRSYLKSKVHSFGKYFYHFY